MSKCHFDFGSNICKGKMYHLCSEHINKLVEEPKQQGGECEHNNTIDIGDSEHCVMACTDCERELPTDPVKEERGQFTHNPHIGDTCDCEECIPEDPTPPQSWEKRFRDTYEGANVWSSKDIDKVIEEIHSLLTEARKEMVEEFAPYAQHDSSCVLSEWSAGRPAKDGGYEAKIGGKWYQTRPKDKTPKCECGLGGILDKLRKKEEGK